MSDPESRKLVDLKVTDLKAELEKRSIERTGIKAVLVEKLQKALKDEGHDPDTYVFPSRPSSEKNTPLRKRRTREEDESESKASEEESNEEKNESEDEKKAMEVVAAEPVLMESVEEMEEDEREKEEADANNEEEKEKGGKDSEAVENEDKVDKAEEPEKQEAPEAKTPVNADPDTYVFPSPPSPKMKTPLSKGRTREEDESESKASEEESNEEKNESEDEKKAMEVKEAEPVLMESMEQMEEDEGEKKKKVEVKMEEADANNEEEKEKGGKDSEAVENEGKVDKAEEPGMQEAPVAETPVNARTEPTPAKEPAMEQPKTPTEDEVTKEEDSSPEEKKDDSNQMAPSAMVTDTSATAATDTAKSLPAKSNLDEQDGKSNAAADAKQSGEDDTTKDVGDSGGVGSNIGKNLWVTGLSFATRATGLKALFSKYGKVVGAKVMRNTKTPPRCYGYITMSTGTEASLCVQKLHLSELSGKIISVVKDKVESSWAPKKQESKKSSDSTTKRPEETRPITAPSLTVEKEEKVVTLGTENECESTPEGKKKDEPAALGTKEAERKDGSPDESLKKQDGKAGHESKTRYSSDRRDSSRHSSRNRSRERHPRVEVPSLSDSKGEVDSQRSKGREMNAEEWRKREETEREERRKFVRKQREESYRLDRKRRILVREREKLDSKEEELLNFEKKLKKESARLEREREELKRQKMSPSCMPEKEQRGTKRPIASDIEVYLDVIKRSISEQRRYESTSTGRYDHPTSSSDRSRDDQSRPAPKELRTSLDRYESAEGYSGRTLERDGGTWHSGGSSSAPYGSLIGSLGGQPPDPPQWPRSLGTAERWVSENGVVSVIDYEHQTCKPKGKPPATAYVDRFDNHKQPLGPVVQQYHKNGTETEEKCVYCRDTGHSIYGCGKFNKLDATTQYQVIKTKLQLCLICLGRHIANDCQAKMLCKECDSRRHNTLLHPYYTLVRDCAHRFQALKKSD